MHQGRKIDKVYIIANLYDKAQIEERLKKLTARDYGDQVYKEFNVVEEVVFKDSFDDIPVSNDSFDLAFEIVDDYYVKFGFVGAEYFNIKCVEGAVLDIIYDFVVYFGGECFMDLDYMDLEHLLKKANNSYSRIWSLEDETDYETAVDKVNDWVNSIMKENMGKGLLSDGEKKMLWFFRVGPEDDGFSFINNICSSEKIYEDIEDFITVNYDSCNIGGVVVSVFV